MKKATILSVLLLALAASSAWAGGLGLRWTACEGDGGVQNITFACNTNANNRGLAASFKLDTEMHGVLWALHQAQEMLRELSVKPEGIPKCCEQR